MFSHPIFSSSGKQETPLVEKKTVEDMGPESTFCQHYERCCPLDACLERRKDRRVLNVSRALTLNPHVLATLLQSVARTLRLK
jgi:hypothetical protein